MTGNKQLVNYADDEEKKSEGFDRYEFVLTIW